MPSVVVIATMLATRAFAAEPQRPNPDQMRIAGQVYEKWCAPCHAAGGHAGTMALAARLGTEKSVLLERTDILDLYVKTVVRYGFQMMPPFKETEISDAELEALAAYVASGGGKRPVSSAGATR